MKRYKIYIAGPHTKGDVAINVRNAIETGNELLKLGHTPFIPHFSHFWHMMFPQDYEVWMQYDFEWVPLCDILLRLDGESSGADREVKLAMENDIPVFYNLKELIEFLKTDVLRDPMIREHIEKKRKKGNSTRIIDQAIQLLFNGYTVIVRDHYQFGSDSKANRLLMDRILRRLDFEHDISKKDIIIDKIKLTLQLRNHE